MSRKQRKYKAQLSKQHTTKLVELRASVTINAGAEEDGKQGPATFAATAYSGGMVPGYTAEPKMPHPYVIDLSGMTNARNVIANLDHKANQRVGHLSTITNDGKELNVEGVLSAATTHRDEVANSTSAGMPWEVSIEGNMLNARKLPAGETAMVNGRVVNGPAFVFRKSQLTGIAFVSQGADEGNHVTIAASAAGEKKMNEFEKFIVRCGADPEAISDEQRAELQDAYDAKIKAEAKPKSAAQSSFAQQAEELRREQERSEQISQMALGSMRDYPMHRDQIKRLADAAIESKTDPKDFELELLRGTRIQAGSFITTGGKNNVHNDPEMIEAAICLSAGMPNIEKHFSEQVLNSVDRAGMRNFSLQQLLLRVASSNGYSTVPGERIHNGNMRTVLEYCFPPATARLAGFSSINLPNILGNVANKEILAGYMEEDQTWTEIADVKPVNNFHAINSYRMLDNLEYEEVGPAGEIKHGTLGEETYSRQAKTYAKMLGLTRQDIINDDLGAFDDIRTRLGMGAAKKFNNIFWAAFMNNASFFTAGLTNYFEGATSNLAADGVGLGLGVTAYRKMRSPAADGTKRMGVSAGRPSLLLVPPELEVNARKLYVSANFITGASATMAEANIYQNLYRPVVQDRLSDSAFTGYSATAWYLFGSTLKPMVVSFLFGNRTPTVESTDADFDTLGVLFRGYHDFGADKSEYLAGVKSKGAS